MKTEIKIARKRPTEEHPDFNTFGLYPNLTTWHADFQTGVNVCLEGRVEEVELLYEHLKQYYSFA
ncbi:MAG: hypothetical protein V3U84_00860 [Thiotrichaceae bacterium]